MAEKKESYVLVDRETGERHEITDGTPRNVAVRQLQQRRKGSKVTQGTGIAGFLDDANKTFWGTGLAALQGGIGELAGVLGRKQAQAVFEKWSEESKRRALLTSPKFVEQSTNDDLINPTKIADVALQSAPSMLPSLALGPLKTAGNVAEGALAYGQTADQIKDTIRAQARDPILMRKMITTPAFQDALDATNGNYAKAVEVVAEHVAKLPALASGAATLGISALLGAGAKPVTQAIFGDVIKKGLETGIAKDRIKGILANIATQGVKESLEETLQSPVQQGLANVGVRGANPEQDLGEGVPESALYGAILGAPGGVVLGGVEGALQQKMALKAKDEDLKDRILTESENEFLQAHKDAGQYIGEDDSAPPADAGEVEPNQPEVDQSVAETDEDEVPLAMLQPEHSFALKAAIEDYDTAETDEERKQAESEVQSILVQYDDIYTPEEWAQRILQGRLMGDARRLASAQPAAMKLEPEQNQALTDAFKKLNAYQATAYENSDQDELAWDDVSNAFTAAMGEDYMREEGGTDDWLDVLSHIWLQNNPGQQLPGSETDEDGQTEQVQPLEEPAPVPANVGQDAAASAEQVPTEPDIEAEAGAGDEMAGALPGAPVTPSIEEQSQAALEAVPNSEVSEPEAEPLAPITPPRDAPKLPVIEAPRKLSEVAKELAIADNMSASYTISNNKINQVPAHIKGGPEIKISKYGNRVGVHIPKEFRRGDLQRALTLMRMAAKNGAQLTATYDGMMANEGLIQKLLEKPAEPVVSKETTKPDSGQDIAQVEPIRSEPAANAEQLYSKLNEIAPLEDDAYMAATEEFAAKLSPRELTMAKAAAKSAPSATTRMVASDVVSAAKKLGGEPKAEPATDGGVSPAPAPKGVGGGTPETRKRDIKPLDVKQGDSLVEKIKKYVTYLEQKPKDADFHAPTLRDLVERQWRLLPKEEGGDNLFPTYEGNLAPSRIVDKAKAFLKRIGADEPRKELPEDRVIRQQIEAEEAKAQRYEEKARKLGEAEASKLETSADKKKRAKEQAALGDTAPAQIPAKAKPLELKEEPSQPDMADVEEEQDVPDADADAGTPAEPVVASGDPDNGEPDSKGGVPDSRSPAAEEGEAEKKKAANRERLARGRETAKKNREAKEQAVGQVAAKAKDWDGEQWADAIETSEEPAPLITALVPKPAAVVKDAAEKLTGKKYPNKLAAIAAIKAHKPAKSDAPEEQAPKPKPKPKSTPGKKPDKILEHVMEKPSTVSQANWIEVADAYNQGGETGILDLIGNLAQQQADPEASKAFKRGLEVRATAAMDILDSLRKNTYTPKASAGITSASDISISNDDINIEAVNKFKAMARGILDAMGLKDVRIDVVNNIVDARTGEVQRVAVTNPDGTAATDAAGKPVYQGAGAVTMHRLILMSFGNIDPKLSVDEQVAIALNRMDHEVVHALKTLGVIRKGEWTRLVNAAKKAGWLDAINATPLYKRVSKDVKEEEAVAEFHRAWVADIGAKRDLKEYLPARSALQRISSFFKGIGSAFKKADTSVPKMYKNADKLFEKIRSGTVGRRARDLQLGSPEKFATNEGKKRTKRILIDAHDGEIPVYLNPSKANLAALMRAAQKGRDYIHGLEEDNVLRYIKYGDNTYVWPAREAIHDQMSRMLIGAGEDVKDLGDMSFKDILRDSIETGYVTKDGGSDDFVVSDGGSYQTPKYIYAGPHMQLKKSGLQDAKDMADEGKDWGEIFEKTGWFTGPDGVMRYEISDHDASMGKIFNQAIKEFNSSEPPIALGTSLGDLLKHRKLYASYPDLKDTRVFFVMEGGANGASYDLKNDVIRINLSYGGSSAEKIMSSLLHEVQHAVQAREAMGMGTSPQNFLPKGFDIKPFMVEANTWTFLNNYIRFNAQKNEGFLPYLNKMANNLLPGYFSPTDFKKSAQEAMAEYLKVKPPYRQKFLKDKISAASAAAIAQREVYQAGVDKYLTAWGEIEARDVQARMRMNAEERRTGEPPYASQEKYMDHLWVQKFEEYRKAASMVPPKFMAADLPVYKVGLDQYNMYSPLVETATRFPQASATREEFIGWLKNQPGVKEDELKNVELFLFKLQPGEWGKLIGGPKATKQEFVNWLQMLTDSKAVKLKIYSGIPAHGNFDRKAESMPQYKQYTVRGNASPGYEEVAIVLPPGMPGSKDSFAHFGGPGTVAHYRITVVEDDDHAEEIQTDMYDVDSIPEVREAKDKLIEATKRAERRQKAGIKSDDNDQIEIDALRKRYEKARADAFIDKREANRKKMSLVKQVGEKLVEEANKETPQHPSKIMLHSGDDPFHQPYDYPIIVREIEGDGVFSDAAGVAGGDFGGKAKALSQGLRERIVAYNRKIRDFEDIKQARDANAPYRNSTPELTFRIMLMQAIKKGRKGLSWNTSEGVRSIPGMESYKGDLYDKRIPKYAEKFLKRFGVVPKLVDWMQKKLSTDPYESEERVNAAIQLAEDEIKAESASWRSLSAKEKSLFNKIYSQFGDMFPEITHDATQWFVAARDWIVGDDARAEFHDEYVSTLGDWDKALIKFDTVLEKMQFRLEEKLKAQEEQASETTLQRWRFDITDEMRAYFNSKGMPRYMAAHYNDGGRNFSHPVQPEPSPRVVPKKGAKKLPPQNPALLNLAVAGRSTHGDLSAATSMISDINSPRWSRKSILTRWWHPLGSMQGQQFYLLLRKMAAGSKSVLADTLDGLYNTMRTASTDDQNEMRRYITTPGAEPSSILDAEARKSATHVKKMFLQFGREMVRKGRLTPEQFAKYKDAYLPRMFMEYAEKQMRMSGIRLSPMSYAKSRAQTALEKAESGYNSFMFKRPDLLKGASKSFDFKNWKPGMEKMLDVWAKQVRKNIRQAKAAELASLKTSGLEPAKMARAAANINKLYRKLSGRVGKMIDYAAVDHAADVENMMASDATKGLIVDPAFLSYAGLSIQGHDIIIGQFLENVASAADFIEMPDLGWVWPKTQLKYRNEPYSPLGLYAKLENAREYLKGMNDPTLRPILVKEVQDMEALLEPFMGRGKKPSEEKADLKSIAYDVKKYKELPDVPSLGNLRGMVVHKAIYNDIMGSMRPIDLEKNDVQKFFEKHGQGAFTLFKQSKTILNPTSHPRQFFQNMVMLNLSGVSFLQMPQLLVKAAKIMVDDSNGIRNPLWEKAKLFGIREGSFTNVETKRALDVLHKLQIEAAKENGKITNPLQAFDVAKKYGKMIHDKTGEWYQLNDTLFRLAKVLHEAEPDFISRGLGKKPMPLGDALLEADEWFFDYSLLGPTSRFLRNTIIPFWTFTYKAIPKFFDVITDYKRGGAMRFLPYVMMAYGLHAAFQAAVGDMSDEEAKAAKLALSENLRKNAMIFPLPFKDNTGRLNFVDLGPFMPWNNVWQAAYALKDIGDKPVESVVDAVKKIGVGNPMLDINTALDAGVDPFTGNMIYDSDLDTPQDQLSKMGWYMMKVFMPPILTEYGVLPKLASKMFGNDLNPVTGKTLESMPNLAMRAFGFNTYALDVDEQIDSNFAAFEYKERDIKENYSRRKNSIYKQMDRIEENPNLSDERKAAEQAKLEAQLEEITNRRDQQLERLGQQVEEYGEKVRPIQDWSSRQ